MSLVVMCALLISTTPQLARSGALMVNRSSDVVNRGEVVYYADCKPPDGFTGGTYSSNSLLPIEKCCPQTDPCDDIQGYCTLKWAIQLYPRMCDHMTYDCRDFQCVCCVKCSEDKCSKCTETRGECKKECRPDEVEDTANPCSFNKCKCCKKCDIQPECQEAGGTCVGSYEQCPIGSHPSNSGCCGGCFCCKPACQPLPACSEVEGAYCSATDHCAGGFYACHGLCQKTSWHGGYESIEKCYCCLPKWTGDYLTLCPADNTTIVTQAYKAHDKGDKPFTELLLSVDATKDVPIKPLGDPVDITIVVTDGEIQTILPIEPLLDSTKIATHRETLTIIPMKPLVPIKPLRDLIEKVDIVQEEQNTEKITNELGNKSINLSNAEKVNNAKNNEKGKYNNNAEKNYTISKQVEHSYISKHIVEDQAVDTETHSKTDSITPNSKHILEAINLLKKLLYKNKSHKKRHTP